MMFGIDGDDDGDGDGVNEERFELVRSSSP